MKATTEDIKTLIQKHLNTTPKGAIPMIVILGPTAVGKTALSIGLAKEFDGEIISADSRQVYKGMDIATDKITPEEMQGVPHHMLDVVEPDEEFSAFHFKEKCDSLIPEIHERGHVPFLVGGTMLYIDAVVGNYDFGSVKPDEALRASLEEYAQKHGAEELHKKLEALDPDAAAKIHPKKVPFVIRAIEKASEQSTQKTSPQSCTSTSQKSATPYHTLKIGLIRPREEIYERIKR